MKFKIWKTSDNTVKPCEQAELISEKRNKYGWLERLWEIKIDSLEDLMKFIDGTKDKCIVMFSADENDGPSIEIYDDYRE